MYNLPHQSVGTMEGKENDGKRPRLPRHEHKPRKNSMDNHRTRGRSQSRRVVSGSSVSSRTIETLSTNHSGSIASGSSGSRPPAYITPQESLGISHIQFTPQRTNKSASRTKSASKPTAPQKTVRTHSKQPYIKEPSARGRSNDRRARSVSRPRNATRKDATGVQHHDRSESRARSTSRHATRIQHHDRSESRARSTSRHATRIQHHDQSKSRARSVQRSTRSRSASQTRSVRSGASRSIGMHELEPNVHQHAIMTTEIQCPVIAEMKQNELFARKAGINFTREGGDALAIVTPPDDNMLIQDDAFLGDLHLSPTHKREGGGDNHFFDDGLGEYGDDMPSNALFLRKDEAPGQMITCDKDLAQLKVVAGQLCIDWIGKDFIAPAIARRIRDFQFAQEKRRKKFGNERPWGILGLYDHLSAVRTDVEWAEIAACRRANGEPYKAWFEFLGEKSTGKNRPFFTYITMSLCTGFMLASLALNRWKIEAFSLNPMLGPSAETLVAMGAKESELIVNDGEVWRMFSAMVLHAGFIHYGLNMMALWFVGKAVEQCHGFFMSLIIFVVPALGGTILSAVFLPSMISVGASGGIFGLIGACLADICMNWGLLFNDFVNGEENNHRHTFVLLFLLLDVIVNSVIGLTPFVDNFTHLGGMIYGFLIATSTMRRVSRDMFEGEKKKTLWMSAKKNCFRFSGLIITLAAMCISFTILMQGDGMTTPCKACTTLSCIPFPLWGSYENKWWYCDDCGSITADARINPETNVFDQLTMHCPNGATYTMAITTEMDGDKESLEANLPTLCRRHCIDL